MAPGSSRARAGSAVAGDDDGFAYRPDANVAFNADAAGALRANAEETANSEDLVFLRTLCTGGSGSCEGGSELLDDLTLSAWLPPRLTRQV